MIYLATEKGGERGEKRKAHGRVMESLGKKRAAHRCRPVFKSSRNEKEKRRSKAGLIPSIEESRPEAFVGGGYREGEERLTFKKFCDLELKPGGGGPWGLYH